MLTFFLLKGIQQMGIPEAIVDAVNATPVGKK